MAELISLEHIPREVKLKILAELGYGSEDSVHVTKDGHVVLDKYIEEPVKIENMIILPGSTLILDNNSLSIQSYLEEYGDVL